MHFHKFLHPANFEFPSKIQFDQNFVTTVGSYRLEVKSASSDIYHLSVVGGNWLNSDSQVKLRLPGWTSGLEGNNTRLTFSPDGVMSLLGKDGRIHLRTSPKRLFGQCGKASLFEFLKEEGDQYYGLGEKWTGFEHSGKTTKFWNTDVWADFHPESFIHGKPAPDPVYVSIPYLIIKRKNNYIGLLLDNPHATFISTGQRVVIANQKSLETEQAAIHLGAEQGQPNLYVLFGPSLAELTRKLQILVGVTPLPPAWALGYHQCRWGYQSEADLLRLDKAFRKHDIPVDGLWLDIDYMDKYKVFTFSKTHFPHPKNALKKLEEAGRKVIPILDPGVARKPGYAVYDRGQAKRAFCLNPQKREYIGLVWPGITVFPDYSLPAVRDWWADEVAKFARLGIYGAWLDMNDPATGQVDNQDMLFRHGAKEHSFYHNQYALGMAMASRQGFLQAHPHDRPFTLSRSGCTGSSRYTAIWTGDNYSNYHHLKNSIATTLNLALSAVPFNGADVGGFGGDTSPELMMDWIKAAFLFPVLRNHTCISTREQEPWALGRNALRVIKRFIQLRYRFRPYLYQLFVQQEKSGEAILRPLFYDFEDTAKLPLGLIDDQFMVGPSLMQAPFVQEKQVTREVILPKGFWYACFDGEWLAGNRKIRTKSTLTTTPLYVRDGSILPLARIKPGENKFDGSSIDFHLFLFRETEASARYFFDDGKSFAYQKEGRSEIVILAKRRGARVKISLSLVAGGFGRGSFTFTTPDDIQELVVNESRAHPCSAQGIQIDLRMNTWIV